jgi:hypothetical protein
MKILVFTHGIRSDQIIAGERSTLTLASSTKPIPIIVTSSAAFVTITAVVFGVKDIGLAISKGIVETHKGGSG